MTGYVYVYTFIKKKKPDKNRIDIPQNTGTLY